MEVEVLPIAKLSPSLLQTWGEIQRKRPELHSPYFRPEFFQAVGAVRNDVEVAILREAGAPVGFFPFERTTWNLAQPVGGRISDFQAMISKPGVSWSPETLLAECRLKGWAFDHWLTCQPELTSYQTQMYESPYLDLQDGFAVYLRTRRDAGSERLLQFQRKLRKMEREVGPLRFLPATRDPAIFSQLLAWKDAKYRERQIANPFLQTKAFGMLEAFLACDTPAFSGQLTALFAGEHLVAALFSLRSYEVLHYSLPGHNEAFKHYSPGSCLLTRLAMEADTLGITHIDLGKGKDEYKESFASGVTLVAEGSVDAWPFITKARAAWRHTRDWVKNSPLYGPARRPIRWMRQWMDWVHDG